MKPDSLKERLEKPKSAWIKAIVWCAIYVLFVAWVGNFWWLFLLPLVFDAFVTQYIPWTWWKKSENKAVLAIMGWVDAIVFALVAVYFINTYLFQNYQIPTSSLEKTLLVGDFLFVSKASYGPRVPMTPLSFPLVQHTFPIINTKSFSEKPQWEYKRLKGFDTIERNDIVVFNFPAGDTVATKMENPDYYSLCHYYGRDAIRNNKQVFGDIVYRPVDRRENYVKRCVGLPGEWLEIRNRQIFINNVLTEDLSGVQHNYFVQTDGTVLSNKLLSSLNISVEDQELLSAANNPKAIADLGLDPNISFYRFPLTQEVKQKLQDVRGVTKIVVVPAWFEPAEVFPLSLKKNWTNDDFGPIYIPKKGATITLNAYNLHFYERVIRVFEGNSFEVRDGKYFINGIETKHYTFKMDYYWMMGDNRHKSADSRSWGFVPEDHVVGRPVLVWLSLNKDKGWFNGKIRFDRFFKNARH